MAFLSPEALEQLSQKSDIDGRYLNISKLKAGAKSKFRFLGKGVVGVQAWTVEGRPVRWTRKPAELPENIKIEEGKPPTQRFLASAVYDYQEKCVRFAVITQRTVQEALSNYMAHKEETEDGETVQPFGEPSCLKAGFDFYLTRTGEQLTTNYTFMPATPAPASETVKEAWDAVKDNIKPTNLFTNEDVFTSSN